MDDTTITNTNTLESPWFGRVLAVIGSAIAIILANYLREKWKNRIKIKRIKRSNDKDLYKFYDLYERVFREEVRISSEQFANWIDIDKKADKEKRVSHYLFICKRGLDVIGFFKSIYCRENNLLFIAYYAIEKKDLQARELASNRMIKHIERVLRRKFPKCKGIVFELEDVDSTKSEEVNLERKARIRLFKSAIKNRGHCAYEIDCNYIQPQIKIDERDPTTDLPLILMYVSLNEDCSITLKLKKLDVITIIHFIYFNIYLPYFINAGQNLEKSENHLLELLESYHQSLAQKVPLNP